MMVIDGNLSLKGWVWVSVSLFLESKPTLSYPQIRQLGLAEKNRRMTNMSVINGFKGKGVNVLLALGTRVVEEIQDNALFPLAICSFSF
jgi:hypothetical protein